MLLWYAAFGVGRGANGYRLKLCVQRLTSQSFLGTWQNWMEVGG